MSLISNTTDGGNACITDWVEKMYIFMVKGDEKRGLPRFKNL